MNLLKFDEMSSSGRQKHDIQKLYEKRQEITTGELRIIYNAL